MSDSTNTEDILHRIEEDDTLKRLADQVEAERKARGHSPLDVLEPDEDEALTREDHLKSEGVPLKAVKNARPGSLGRPI